MPHPVLPATLLTELRSLPVLDGAACHAPMWDNRLPDEHDDDRTERHRLARRICAHCPARRACSALVAGYRADQLDGIWAGRLRAG